MKLIGVFAILIIALVIDIVGYAYVLKRHESFRNLNINKIPFIWLIWL